METFMNWSAIGSNWIPEEVSEQILTIKRKLGVNHFIFSMEWAGMEASVATDCMHLMAEECFLMSRALHEVNK
ncbi:MAG: hypothetical protein CM15mP62_06590 [Rhodospirillaceae bacterium]|nr:MAG: hypothetical protein CM15mP62_06590 [Rhodospirillaceae bacterium]